MKNIHIVPTDKPNFGKYLVLNKEGRLCIWNTNTMGSQKTLSTQHIYITSDEEIEEGDWYLTFLNKEVIGKPRKCEDSNWNFSGCKKIILTTDTDLIKDGVQAIDDEFLEWFVKNPSCEWVEVNHFGTCCGNQLIAQCINCTKYNPVYKIIIPKEELTISDEAKQRAKNYMSLKGALEPKQETLEEAGKNTTKKYINNSKYT